MEKVVAYAKAHPWVAGGVVLGIGVVLVLLFSGGSETEEVSQGGGYSPYPSVDQAANAMLVQSQLGAQVATTQLNNSLAAEKDANATAAAVAKLNFDYLSNKDVLAAKVSIRGLEAEEFGISKAAEVSTLQIKKAFELGVHAENVKRQNVADLANTDRYVAGLTAQTEREKNQLAAQDAAAKNQIAAQTAQNNLVLGLGQQHIDARNNELKFVNTNYTALLASYH